MLTRFDLFDTFMNSILRVLFTFTVNPVHMERQIMREIREDRTMRFITLSVRTMYVFGLAYFGHAFWSARVLFYSPPVNVLIAAYMGLLCTAAMLSIFGIWLFAKRPNMVLGKILFLHQ